MTHVRFGSSSNTGRWAFATRRIRRKVSAALERYRVAFRAIAETATPRGSTNGRRAPTRSTSDGVAAVAVSLIHGCAFQAVIDAKAFSVQQHFDTAARMLDSLDGDLRGVTPRPRVSSSRLTR